jgi:hypothetical protein
VDDTLAMARNVEAIWQDRVGGGVAAMGEAARAHVEAHYDWSRTFDRLFDGIYPAALATTRARLVAGEPWRLSKLITVPVAPLLAWGGGHATARSSRARWTGAIGQDTYEPG